MRWTNQPGLQYSPLYYDMSRQPHLLVAGATGSGKSVVINGIIHSLLVCETPASAQFILIDPKRVELVQYKNLPHTLTYASELCDMCEALRYAIRIIEDRFADMQKRGLRRYDGSDVYIIIDELADLLLVDKKTVQPLIQRIAQLGRAALCHLIMATQCPLSQVISTPIKCNIDARIGLRTRSAQDSRNILGQAGCETLPRYGFGYYLTPETPSPVRYPLHMFTDNELQDLVNYWTSPRCMIA